jgi:3-deoxy-D-manno-octulosonic-acid transferase
MKPKPVNFLWLALVNFTYLLAILFGWIVYLPLLVFRKKTRHNFWERWGFGPAFPAGRKRLWIHAISVGEVEAARTFLPALAAAFPDAGIVFSTTTMTGRERAHQLFPGRPIFYLPFDFAPCVLLTLFRVKPTAIIQVESEWWPNFFLISSILKRPIVCVNVRLTEKGQKGYKRIPTLMANVFNSTRAIGVQADVYGRRLIELGTDPERLRVTGQMKHDGVAFTDTVPGAAELAREMKIDPREPVIVAGSTAPEELAILLASYHEIRAKAPSVRLVIVPRRPENFDSAAETILKAGCGLIRRSKPDEIQGEPGQPIVLLGDTMGELMKWYGRANVVFIGRSLVPLGGSNPMEPGSIGKAILWGPHMFNFPVEAAAFEAAGAARQVTDAATMTAAIIDLLAHVDVRRRMGDAARETIRTMQGATARSILFVREALAEEL